MKERIAAAADSKTSGLFIGTFHSYCLLLLKIHGHRLGYENSPAKDSACPRRPSASARTIPGGPIRRIPSRETS